MPLEDTVFFSQFLARLRPLRVFEFGTNWGISTANIALNTPEDARIWTMDVCQEMFSPDALAADRELQMILTREHTGWFYRQSAALHKKVEQVFADSRTFDMATMREPEGGFDLVLVDACHKYDFVLKDTENALKKLRPGGWILWHDYYPDVSSWVDVFRYLSDFARTHQGVMHAKGTHFAFWRKP